MISVVINADTRQGYLSDSSAIGDFGEGSLEGVRSVDFITEGVKNKMNFFRGYDCQCILYIDRHEDLIEDALQWLKGLVGVYGNNSKLIFKEHNRTKPRWYDHITIEALKLAEGDYVVHFDNDANAFRSDGSDIVEKYFKWLDEGYKFICQPTNMTKEEHGMFWASTRFFICGKETLNFTEIEANLTTPLRGRNTPCLEHVLSVLNNEKVLYPPREDEKYIVFNWAKYFKGTLKKLNEMPYSEAIKYVNDCGIHGPNDVIDKKEQL